MEGEVVSKPRSFSNSMISTWRDCQALGFVEYVERIKLQTMLLSGVFCGLAGAYLSLGYVSLFANKMTNERGLIALAAVWSV